MVKLKKFFVMGAALLLGATMLTGCSQAMQDAQDNIDKTTVNALNESKIVRQVTDAEFENFTFLGDDFQRDNNRKLNVEVSGLAKYDNSQSAFVNLSYNDVGENFVEVENDDKAAIINALSAVIQDKELGNFEFSPVSSAQVVNDTLKDIAESPVENYNFNKGMAFSVGNVSINKEEGYASFEVKSNINYSRTVTEVTYGITGCKDGKVQHGMITRVKTYNEDYLHTHRVYVKGSEKELEAMESDTSLIFDKFYTVVKEKQKSDYVVESLKVESAQEYDTKMINDVDYKDL